MIRTMLNVARRSTCSNKRLRTLFLNWWNSLAFFCLQSRTRQMWRSWRTPKRRRESLLSQRRRDSYRLMASSRRSSKSARRDDSTVICNCKLCIFTMYGDSFRVNDFYMYQMSTSHTNKRKTKKMCVLHTGPELGVKNLRLIN